MKLLVYTCVFGGYDRVFPPVVPEAALDYVIVTDDAALDVPGWRTHAVDLSRFATPKAANLHYRALIHRELPGYDAALYHDGNIRLLGKTSDLFAPFLETGAALGVIRHPLRSSVAEEVEACISAGKVSDPAPIRAELAEYQAAGFPDDAGLIETTIMLRNHRAKGLDDAMTAWNDLYQRHLTRDQISLPFALWQTGADISWRDALSWRVVNSYFGRYPHRGAKGVRPAYADLVARAYDSTPRKALLMLWHGWWGLRRWMRKGAGA